MKIWIANNAANKMMPMVSDIPSGYMSSNPAQPARIRSNQYSFRYQKPIIPAPMPIIPVNAVNTTQMRYGIVVSIIRSSGDNTNIYGMTNAATANFDAFIPVRIGSPLKLQQLQMQLTQLAALCQQQFRSKIRKDVQAMPVRLAG